MPVTDKSQLNNAGMCRLLRHGRSLANEAGIVISQRVSVVGTAAVPVGTCMMMTCSGVHRRMASSLSMRWRLLGKSRP